MTQPPPEQSKIKRVPVPLIVVAYMVGYVQGGMTAFSLVNGLWPSAMAAPGPLSRILPGVLCLGLTICLGATWKVIFHHIARTRSFAWGAAWLILALMVWAAAIGTSGGYMAALIDGAGAIQQHEQDYLHRVDGAVRSIEARAGVDRPLIAIAESQARNLRGLQDGERKFGTISGKAGSKGVTDAIGRGADALDALLSSLRADDARRADYLAQADRALSDARNAVGRDDQAGFGEHAETAVRLLKQAGAISLLNGAGGLGTGMVVEVARAPFEQAKREIDQFVAIARERQVAVEVPVFHAMSDKKAVMEYPPLAAWILAIMIESFPFFMTVALLFSNLEGQKPTLAPAE